MPIIRNGDFMTIRTGARRWLLIFALAAGCAPGEGPEARETEPPEAVVEPAREVPSEGEWTVTEAGFGPVRAGMTVAEADRALGGRLDVPPTPEACDYARLRDGPEGVSWMVVDGRVARVDVSGGTIATDRGARVGDSEERVRALYAGRVETQPHRYTDGHYLVVTPAEPGDRAFRLLFETDGEVVTRYRAGTLPEVAWVEGCA